MSTKAHTKERADFLAGVITTAVEGGINYWANIHRYKWADPQLGWSVDTGGDAATMPSIASAEAVIRDRHDDEAKEWALTMDLVEEALEKIRSAEVFEVPRRAAFSPRETSIPYLSATARAAIVAADALNDGGDIDSDLADIIVQVAILGEVVYG